MADAEVLLHVEPDVVWDVVDGVLTVCRLERGVVHELNGVGATVWTTGLTGDRDAVLDQLTRRYPGVPVTTLETDVTAFVDVLHGLGLVR